MRTGIEDFRFHDLRHTFGSHLVMQGVDLRTVQQVMGHKDIGMTMRYSHLSPEYVQKTIERLDRLWTPNLKKMRNKFYKLLKILHGASSSSG
jgi:integrase